MGAYIYIYIYVEFYTYINKYVIYINKYIQNSTKYKMANQLNNWKEHKSPLGGERTDKLRYQHPREHCSAIRRNDLTHGQVLTTQRNLKTTMKGRLWLRGDGR